MQDEDNKPEVTTNNIPPDPSITFSSSDNTQTTTPPVLSPINSQQSMGYLESHHRPDGLNNQQINPEEAVEKVRPNRLFVSIILGLLSLIAVGLSIYFNNPNILGYEGNIYLDIAKTCPALKDNILKMDFDSTLGRNLVVTKSNELYYLVGVGNIESSGLRVGDCGKIKELNNVKDIQAGYSFHNYVLVTFNDGSSNSYSINLWEGKYNILEIPESNTNLLSPLADNEYSSNMSKYKIKSHFYINTIRKPHFIDDSNNIYNTKFIKIIDRSSFDSTIVSATVMSEYNNFIYIKTDKYLYVFNSKGDLIEKQGNYYGVEAADIRFIHSDGVSSSDSTYYIVRNDGNFYKFKKNIQTTSDIVGIKRSSSSYLITLPIIVLLVVFVGLSYHGQKKRYISGIIKAFAIMVVLNVIWGIYGQIKFGGNELFALFTINRLLRIIILSIIYFNIYYLLKRIIWALMHKAKTGNLLIFATIYSLIAYILYLLVINLIISFINNNLNYLI